MACPSPFSILSCLVNCCVTLGVTLLQFFSCLQDDGRIWPIDLVLYYCTVGDSWSQVLYRHHKQVTSDNYCFLPRFFSHHHKEFVPSSKKEILGS